MTWAELFSAYITKHDIPRPTAAKELDVSETTIHYWLKAGATARKPVRDRVERWSKGRVPSNLDVCDRLRALPSAPPPRAA